MSELRGDADQPGRADRPERSPRAGGADAGALRQRIEPRSRTEYAADLEQQVVSGWDRRAFGPQMAEPLDGAKTSGAPADRSEGAERTGTPFDVVRRFEPQRAGLPEASTADAVAYINARYGERPWLSGVRGCSPEVQRVFAVLDQAGGHGHIRHEGGVTEAMNHRRVAYLEDPAQRDLAKRAAGVDGMAQMERRHSCGDTATRVTDPDAFAVAFARGAEHPKVRQALDQAFERGKRPSAVSLPIETLLGPDGHRYCTGWRLEPVGGSMAEAQDRRAAWVKTRAADAKVEGLPEPLARPVETFAGGSIVFVFGPNRARDGYEIVTLYPRPREHQS